MLEMTKTNGSSGLTADLKAISPEDALKENYRRDFEQSCLFRAKSEFLDAKGGCLREISELLPLLPVAIGEISAGLNESKLGKEGYFKTALFGLKSGLSSMLQGYLIKAIRWGEEGGFDFQRRFNEMIRADSTHFVLVTDRPDLSTFLREYVCADKETGLIRDCFFPLG